VPFDGDLGVQLVHQRKLYGIAGRQPCPVRRPRREQPG